MVYTFEACFVLSTNREDNLNLRLLSVAFNLMQDVRISHSKYKFRHVHSAIILAGDVPDISLAQDHLAQLL